MLVEEFQAPAGWFSALPIRGVVVGNQYWRARSRNPYVDPMSLVQVELLRRKRAAGNTDGVDYALGATINGIAAGLHNTG